MNATLPVVPEADVRDQILRDGYVVFRQVFSPTEITMVSDALDRLVDRASGLTDTQMVDGSQFVVDLDDDGVQRIHRIVWCGAAEPTLLSIGRDPRMLEIASQFLAGAKKPVAFDHLINQAHFKYPGDGVKFDFHQDSIHRRYGTPLWTDVNGNGSFVQIAIAVDPMTLDNGPLQVVPGSHAHGHRDVDENRHLPPDSFDPNDVQTLTMEPGDVVAWGSFLIHGSQPNESDSPRRVLINGFSIPGANHRIYPGEGAGETVMFRPKR